MHAKLIHSTLWNLGSFATTAIAGLFLNLAIGRIYGPSILGEFNIVLAIYIVASQFSTFGMQFGLLQKLAYDLHSGRASSDEIGIVTSSALGVVAVAAGAVCAVLMVAAITMPRLFPSETVASGVLIASPGLIFFSLNKTLLAALNALECMRDYAIGQALRYVFIIILLAAWIGFGWSGTTLPAVLTLSEAAVAIVLWRNIGSRVHIRHPNLGAQSTRELTFFGLRALWSGMAAEINTKVDILVLSAFASAETVGIYSIAALIFEGLAQLPLVLRTVINPKLSVLARPENAEELRIFIRPIKWISGACMMVVAVVVALVFPLFVDFILGNPAFLEAWIPVTILVFGLAVASVYVPLDMVLVQGGKPGVQSFLKIVVVAINVTANLILVPFFGMIGAAIGTASATICAAILTVVMMRRYLGLYV